MQLKYGGYSHENDGVSFTVQGRRVFDKYNKERRLKVRYVITGVITGTTASDITTKCTALEDAYRLQSQDLVFYDNDSNPTVHSLRTGDCLGGTRTHGPDWLDGMPGVWGSATEYVDKRTYRVVVEGDIAYRGGLISWSESWVQIGTAGPETRWVESLVDDPVRQVLKQKTTTLGIQSGAAVGDDTYPPIPPAMFPDLLMNIKGQSPKTTLWTPEFYRDGQMSNYKASWMYVHESPVVLAVTPTPSP
jgi:hypothetical protein